MNIQQAFSLYTYPVPSRSKRSGMVVLWTWQTETCTSDIHGSIFMRAPPSASTASRMREHGLLYCQWKQVLVLPAFTLHSYFLLALKDWLSSPRVWCDCSHSPVLQKESPRGQWAETVEDHAQCRCCVCGSFFTLYSLNQGLDSTNEDKITLQVSAHGSQWKNSLPWMSSCLFTGISFIGVFLHQVSNKVFSCMQSGGEGEKEMYLMPRTTKTHSGIQGSP